MTEHLSIPSLSVWGKSRPIIFLLTGVVCCAFAFAVFLRWQQGVLTQRAWDLAPYGIAKGAWLCVACVVIFWIAARDWRRNQASVPNLALLCSMSALSVSAYSALPASYSSLAPLMGLAAILATSTRSIWPIVLWLLIALMTSCLSFYERRYGEFSGDALRATLQTSPFEYGAYLREHLSVAHGALVASILFSAVLLRIFALRINMTRGAGTVLVILSLPALLPVTMGLLQQIRNSRDTIRQVQEEERDLAIKPVLTDRAHDRDLDVVLVLGESSTRWNWELYGYPRKTTPLLENQRKDLIVFSDSISVHSHTVPVLSAMFYRRGTTRSTDIAEVSISLIDVLRSAGVETEWISAQLRHGPFATPISRLADSAQFTWFAAAEGASLPMPGANRDVMAFDRLKQRISLSTATKPRLFVLHMQAAHFPYCAELPTEDRAAIDGLRLDQRYFGDAPDRSKDIECYDQAIRFTDRMLSDLIDSIRTRKRPTVLLFAPDHGEAPAEGTGHQSDAHSAKHIEIPMLAYFNPAASKSTPQLFNGLQQNRDRPFLNKWLFELISDAFGVTLFDVDVAAPSLASLPYEPPQRVAFPDTKPVQYDDNTFDDRKDYLSRTRTALRTVRARTGTPTIYAHRTNTIGKAIEARAFFQGIEMDLAWRASSSHLEVLHPPKPSIGLKVDEQLTQIEATGPHSYWFDVKTGSTDQRFWETLGQLDKRFGIKTRSLVELSGDYDPELVRSAVAEKWQLALPIRTEMPTCGLEKGEGDCIAEARRLEEVARGLGVSHLSFDIADLHIARKYVLRSTTIPFKLAVWDSRTPIDSQGFLKRLAMVANADAFAIRFDSRFGH